MSSTGSSLDDDILDAIDGGIIVIDKHRHIVHWNAWMVSASGRSAASTNGKTLDEVFSGVDLSRLNSAVNAALISTASTIISRALNAAPLPLKTRSGRQLLHDITVSPAGDQAHRQSLIFITDVTMATRREQYLRDQQNARYNAVVESAPDVIISIDSDGVIQMANPSAVSQFGYAMDELIGKQVATLFDTKSAWSSVWHTTIDDVISLRSTELVALRKDGSLSHVEASASRWRIGSRLFVTVILRDINERIAIETALRASEAAARSSAEALSELNQTLENRVSERTAQLMNAEEALRQSHKMKAVGQLTGGIAHDFNNLLQGITGALHVIRKRISLGRIGDLDRFITGALESANRAASLTHRLLAFSRQQPVDPRPLNENQLIASIEELLRRTIGETVQLKILPTTGLWLVRCDANQLENALLNLAINARDAMPTGGLLIFETSNRVLNVDEARLREVEPGEYVQLIVKDTGTGMTPEVRARIFEPFYTTKAIGKGTVLGLSMIYGFIKQSDGSVMVESEPGKGTSIEVCLPRYRGDLVTESVAEISRMERRAGSDEVVLVVEDEAMVRLLVVEVLKDLGYYALEADSGAPAIRILQSPQRVDLLIADVGLPDISGRQVVEAGVSVREDLKVLLMTGYAEKAASDSFLDEGMEMIMKPFAMDVLAARIRDMIERH